MGALNWNPEITKHNQRLFMKENEQERINNAFEFSFVDGAGWKKGAVEPFSLDKFSFKWASG